MGINILQPFLFNLLYEFSVMNSKEFFIFRFIKFFKSVPHYLLII